MFPLDIGFHGLGDGSAGKVLATKSGHLSLIPGGHVNGFSHRRSTHEEDEEEEIKEMK